MIESGRTVLTVAAVLAWAMSAHAQPAQITITDHLSSGQLEETVAVYLSGRLAGTLHVDPAHPDDSFTTGVTGGTATSYTLCGLLRRQHPDGTITNHPIDNRGQLTPRPGASYAALTLNDVLFALVDESGDTGDRQLTPGPVCAAAVS